MEDHEERPHESVGASADFDADARESNDPFYSESNIRYLERKKREIDEGEANLAEHDLIEVEIEEQ